MGKVHPNTSPPTRGDILALLGMAVSSFLYRAIHFQDPSLRDEGIFAYIAQESLRGYLPLTTTVDQKGVLLYWEMAVALFVFGDESMAGVRALAALFVGLSIFAMYELGRRMFGRRTGLLAALLLALHLSLRSLDSQQCGTEIFATLPSILCVLFVWRGFKERKTQLFVLGGIFLAFTFWTRATYLLLAAFFVTFLAIFEERGYKLKHVGLGVAGALLGSAPILACYALQGHLERLWQVYYSFILAWRTAGPFLVPNGDTNLFPVIKVFATRCSVLLLTPLVGCYFWNPKTKKRTEMSFLLLWILTSFLLFKSAGIYLQKQVVQFMPALTLLSALTLEWALSSKARALKGLVTVITAASLALTASGEGFFGASPSPTQPSVFRQSRRLAHWIRKNSEPEETLYIWGLEWQVYFHSQRRSPIPQINLQYIIACAVSAESGLAYFKQLLPKIEADVLEPFESEQAPKFLVFTAKLDNYGLQGYKLPQKIESILARDYDFLFSDEPFYVFLHKGESLEHPKLPLPLDELMAPSKKPPARPKS